MHVYACGFLHSRHVPHSIDEHLLAARLCMHKRNLMLLYLLPSFQPQLSFVSSERWKVWPLPHSSYFIAQWCIRAWFYLFFFLLNLNFYDKPPRLGKVTVHRPVIQPGLGPRESWSWVLSSPTLRPMAGFISLTKNGSSDSQQQPICRISIWGRRELSACFFFTLTHRFVLDYLLKT